MHKIKFYCEELISFFKKNVYFGVYIMIIILYALLANRVSSKLILKYGESTVTLYFWIGGFLLMIVLKIIQILLSKRKK